MYCIECGKNIKENINVCNHCGFDHTNLLIKESKIVQTVLRYKALPDPKRRVVAGLLLIGTLIFAVSVFDYVNFRPEEYAERARTDLLLRGIYDETVGSAYEIALMEAQFKRKWDFISGFMFSLLPFGLGLVFLYNNKKVDLATQSFQFIGNLKELRESTIKSLSQMSISIQEEITDTDGFMIKAGQSTNWISYSFPLNYEIKVEKIGQSYAVTVSGSSSMGSLFQSMNNTAKVQELISLIKVYASSTTLGDTGEQVTKSKGKFSSADELMKFKKLLDDGIISQSEFEEKKKQLL